MPTQRLSAMMFTDIVGYTALMQRNQAEAMAAVKAYEAVLKSFQYRRIPANLWR